MRHLQIEWFRKIFTEICSLGCGSWEVIPSLYNGLVLKSDNPLVKQLRQYRVGGG